MSDHEEISERGSGYDTPVPELDDHRHQSASVQRPDRPRRGTVDTLYGTRHLETPPDIRVRDFEEAIADDEADDVSPVRPRSRRPTVDTVNDGRSLSPPNSVKAFAEARRRGRAYSTNNKEAEDTKEDGEKLHLAPSTLWPMTLQVWARTERRRTMSVSPMNDEHRQDRLYIDFDYLENFIAAENAARKEELDAANATKVFPNLQTEQFRSPSPMVTADGDIYQLPPGTGMTDEKQIEETAEKSDAEATKQDPIDPNRFSFFSTAWESTIHAAEFGDLVLPGENVRGLFQFPSDVNDGVWWLNMNSPTEEEVRTICKAFGVHPLTIEDITTQEAREKIELFPSYYFACFRSFSVTQEEDGPDYEPFNLYVIVFREGTLSFSFEPNSHASLVRKRITMLKEYVSLSSDWICYALIDNIVDSFAPAIHRIELITEGIEDSVFVARADDMHSFLRRIGAVRKNTLGLMRILGGKADVLKGFTKRCNENYKVTPRMDIGMYLGDIQDHVVTMMTNLTHFEKILSRAHSNYLAQLTIDSIAQGTKTNEVLSKITFLASVIVPLNVVTGLFGMNVHVPWQDIENLHAFIAILCSLVGFVLISLLIARKARYI
ncbi:metal ion transporter [Apiospora rasikravindrae]|uniref:Metal ion transporter n=1 Tax=Apiospora rasikravindrae TaxID=990691 RepID=A0ABR1SMX9_9PEZI